MTMPHTFTNLVYRVIFSTKHRRLMIHDAFRDRLLGYIAGILDRPDIEYDDRFANG